MRMSIRVGVGVGVGVRTEYDDRGGAVPYFFVLRPGQLDHALRCWVRHVHFAQYAVAVIGHHYATLKNIARNVTHVSVDGIAVLCFEGEVYHLKSHYCTCYDCLLDL
jgi:hypothetical protein